jgi:hypothetical protein
MSNAAISLTVSGKFNSVLFTNKSQMKPILMEVVITHLEVTDSSLGWRNGGTEFLNYFLDHSKGIGDSVSNPSRTPSSQTFPSFIHDCPTIVFLVA